MSDISRERTEILIADVRCLLCVEPNGWRVIAVSDGRELSRNCLSAELAVPVAKAALEAKRPDQW